MIAKTKWWKSVEKLRNGHDEQKTTKKKADFSGCSNPAFLEQEVNAICMAPPYLLFTYITHKLPTVKPGRKVNDRLKNYIKCQSENFMLIITGTSKLKRILDMTARRNWVSPTSQRMLRSLQSKWWGVVPDSWGTPVPLGCPWMDWGCTSLNFTLSSEMARFVFRGIGRNK